MRASVGQLQGEAGDGKWKVGRVGGEVSVQYRCLTGYLYARRMVRAPSSLAPLQRPGPRTSHTSRPHTVSANQRVTRDGERNCGAAGMRGTDTQ